MFFFIIGVILLLIGGAVAIVANVSNEITDEGKRLGTFTGLGVVLFSLLLLFLSMFRVVPANSIGIPVTFGSAGKPIRSGLHFTGPFTNVKTFSTRVQTSARLSENDKDCVQAAADDGAVLCVDTTVRYKVNINKVNDLYSRYGNFDRVREVLVRRETEEALQTVYGLFTPEEAVSGETASEISNLAKAALSKRFDSYGITVDSITIGRVHVDAKVQERIDAKIQARQDGERALIEQAKAVTEAQTKQKQAKIAADEAVARANGEADAARIKAQGEADANRLITQSLTPELLQRLYYAALSNAKTLVVTGDAQTILTP